MIRNAATIAEVLLLIGAGVGLFTAYRDLTDRRHWDQVDQIAAAFRAEGASTTQIEAVRERLRNERHGGHRPHKRIFVVSLVLFVAGAIFFVVASVMGPQPG